MWEGQAACNGMCRQISDERFFIETSVSVFLTTRRRRGEYKGERLGCKQYDQIGPIWEFLQPILLQK